MPNWKKVIVSGSNAVVNEITSSGGIYSSEDIYSRESKLGRDTYLQRDLVLGTEPSEDTTTNTSIIFLTRDADTGMVKYHSLGSNAFNSNTYNNYSLPLATNTVRGGIELFSNTDQSVAANSVTTTAGRTYGIQLNSANQAVVNVPWTNTTYSPGSLLDLSGTTFNVDLSELTDMTETFVKSTDEFVVLDSGVQKRKLASEIFGSNAFNSTTIPSAANNATITIAAGNALTTGGNFTTNQGSNETITIHHADTSTQSSVNNSGRTYIQDITLDDYGHITGITSATETVVNTDTNTNRLTTFQVEDGDGTEVTISHGKEWKFLEGQGINVNWTDTSNGSDADPFDLQFALKANGVRANELNVSGNGTTSQFLRSDGDGSFTWATPTKSQIGLGNVANESRATILGGNLTGTINSIAVDTVTEGAALGATANQDSTATIRSGTTATNVGLGNVTNESKATMFSSPAFTGNPTAPTQTSTNDSTRIATTAFVQGRIDDIIGNAGSTLDTLGELSASLASDQSGLASLTTTVGTKLAKASNLSDLTNASTARNNLGLGSAATKSSTTTVTDGSSALPDGNAVYDHVTSRISGLTSNTGTVSSLSDLSITATAAEINKLDGVTATTAELNFVDGVTSNIQTQLNGKMESFKIHDGDGTEVKITNAKYIKFAEGTGIDIDWTDTSSGTEEAPYDLTITNTAPAGANHLNSNTTKADVGLGNVDNKSSATIRGEITSANIPNNAANTTGNAATATLAANSTLAGGLAVGTGRNNTANQIVRTNASGYAEFGWINTTSGNTTNTITDFYVNTNDGYIRKATPSHVRSQLNVADGATNVTNNNQIANGRGYITSFTNTVDMGDGFKIVDGNASPTTVTITENKYLKFVQGTGIDIRFTDGDGGTEADPYDLTIGLAGGGVGAGTYGSTSNGTKIDQITVDAYGRVTNITTGGTGDINGITAGVGLSGGGTSGTPTLTLDMSELTDMTATMVGTDEFIVLDAGADRRKAANEIGLSIFNNDAGFITDGNTNWNNSYGFITGLNWEEIDGAQSDIMISGFNNDSGFTSNTGTLESLTINTSAGLDGGGTYTTTGTTTISLDLSELTDKTDAIDASVDEIIMLDNGAERRKRFAEIFGSNAYNSTTIPTNNNQLTNGAGYITSYVDTTYSAGNGIGLSGTTFSVAAGTGLTQNSTGLSVTSNGIGATQLNVSGNGTAKQFLRSDGDGSFTWAIPTDTNTTYSADGNYGMALSGTTFRLEDDRRRNSTTVDIYTGNTHDFTWYDADVGIRWYTAGAEEMRLDNSGNLHVDADVIAYSTTLSDERLKDNVTTIESPLDKIKALRGVEYDWNNGNRKGKHDLGLIAQEVEKVLPNIVHEHEMPFLNDDEEDDTLYKTVDYEKLTAVLIEGMKEQQSQIDELKSEINKLKGSI